MNDLLKTTRDLIQNFASGDITYQDAQNEYNVLLQHYKKKHQTRPTLNNKYLQGILYHHNCENFCKLSAVFLQDLTRETITVVEHYGDENLLSILNDYVKLHIEKTNDYMTHTNHLAKSNNLDYYIHLKKIKLVEQDLWCISISSSHYFDKYLFNQLAQTVSQLYAPLTIAMQDNIIDLSYFLEKQLLHFQLNYPLHQVSVEVFIFNSLNKIFNHLGIRENNRIYNYICDSLEQHFSLLIRPIVYNNGIFIVFNNNTKKELPAIEYNNILLLYKHKKIELDNNSLTNTHVINNKIQKFIINNI